MITAAKTVDSYRFLDAIFETGDETLGEFARGNTDPVDSSHHAAFEIGAARKKGHAVSAQTPLHCRCSGE